MVHPSTSCARAVRWQRPLAIIVVLSSMLTTSTPAAPDTECVDLDELLTDLLVTYTAPSGEKVVQLTSAVGTDAVTLCARRPDQSNPVLGVRFEVAGSNVVLDCGGVVFDGSPFIAGSQLRVPSALSFKPVSPAIHDVVVRNCVFKKHSEGIKIIGAGITDPPEKGLVNITLQDIVLRDISTSAVIIGPHNRDNLLENVEITGAGWYGVHLQAYSSRTTIREGYFAENGWSASVDNDGYEAIAIDASSHNVITDSYFYHNRYAGIALYKNCGQDATPRKEGANYNTIERNEFYKHDHANALTRGGAIVVASRQGLDLADPKDVFSGSCSDAGHKTSVGTRYRDIARHNIVRRNSFAFNLTAIRVRDSFNRIEGNTFTGDSWDNGTKKARHGVVADAKLLKDIGEPATGITVIDNVTLTKTSPVGQNYVRLHDATMLFANNVDRSYQCVADSLAPGNRCNPATLTDPAPSTEPGTDPVIPLVDPLDRCEVVIEQACPARAAWAGFSHFPGYWLETLYGANILPDRCEERAQEIWEWCKVDDDDVFKVTTTAVVDGARAEPTIYDGP